MVDLVVPRSWYRTIYPRRGGAAVGYTPDPQWADGVARMLQLRIGVRRALEHEQTPAHIASAGLAFLDDAAEPTPLGAAATAIALIGPSHHSDFDFALLTDGWIERHGLEFAVRAAMELSDLRYGLRRVRRQLVDPVLPQTEFDVYAGVAQVLGRVRTALAAAPDDVYEAMVAVLASGRDGTLFRRIATSFLAPDRSAWVDDDADALVQRAAAGPTAVLLLASATSPDQLRRIAPAVAGCLDWIYTPTMLHTLAEGLGEAIVGPLMQWRSRPYVAVDDWRAVVSTLAAIPDDAALQALLDNVGAKFVPAAIVEAAERSPRPALRLLAAAEPEPRITDLLRRLVARHADLVEAVLPELPDAAAARIRAIVDAATAARTGSAESLPDLLVTPPWLRRRAVAKPTVVTGLRCTDAPSIEWEPGERDRLLAELPRKWPTPLDVQAAARTIVAGNVGDDLAQRFFEEAPVEMAAPLLAGWHPRHLWGLEWWLPPLVARFELDAFPLLMTVAQRSPADAGPHLARFTSPTVASMMADWLARLKSTRKLALAWLRGHPAAAARALVPAALGRTGPARRNAEQALVALAASGHHDAVLEAARHYGAPAAAAIEALLGADPLDALPAKIPVPPDWADTSSLAPLQLRDGAGALPADAVHHVLTMLAMSKLGAPYAGLTVVKDACEPDSVASFGRSLLRCWLLADAPPADSWALEAQAVLGDDRTARELAQLVREWPYEGAHARAAAGLDVLAKFGSEAALAQLHDIATKMKAKAVRTRAQDNLREAAEELGLTADQLADRLVPDFDLAPSGTLTLDYGPRRFVVGFDEQLKPRVADEDGTRRKDLPKPAASDDAELASAAYKRFGALKKGVRGVASEQVRRLELAMVMQRRWSGAEFRPLFLRHPLLWHIARRLVWATFTPAAAEGNLVTAHGSAPTASPGDLPTARDSGRALRGEHVAASESARAAAAGGFVGAFRIAEDRSLADVEDNPVEVGDDAVVGVAHPLHLGGTAGAWHEVFADYEILQPFQQLGRTVLALTGEERAATRLTRFDGLKADTLKLIGLERRGWRRTGQEGGYQSAVEHDLPDGRVLTVLIEPGISLGSPKDHPEQVFTDIWIRDARGGWAGEHTTPFSTLDAVIASEILRDLTETTTA